MVVNFSPATFSCTGTEWAVLHLIHVVGLMKEFYKLRGTKKLRVYGKQLLQLLAMEFKLNKEAREYIKGVVDNKK